LNDVTAEVQRTGTLQGSGFLTFVCVWLGQTVSIFGSSLTAFALGVWVYQSTGSVTRFGLLTFCATMPTILVSPIVGTLVDRWDRRWAMILANMGSGLAWVALALLFWKGSVQYWQLGLVVAANSCFAALQIPALAASIPLLVPKQHLGRANGLIELGNSCAVILAPVLAGVLVQAVDVRGIILIDLATFLFAILALLAVRIPQPPRTFERAAGETPFWRAAGSGWSFIRQRPGLVWLLSLFAVLNFTLGTVETLLTPLVLSFASSAVLGTVLSSAGLGMLTGGITMVAWGAAAGRRIQLILGFAALQGTLLLLGGLRPSIPLVAAVAFAYMAAASILSACSQTIWQSKVPPELQGRVMATRRMISAASVPLAYLITGVLADQVFEPLLAAGGPLAGSVGRVLGVGQGRGIGLLFLVLGALVLASAVAGFRKRSLRHLEEELPDALPDRA
jgi:MFS transporter, DHA3 family, macrolide efflux protein